MTVEKRVRFKSWWLPWVLVAPQLIIVCVFFFWPAAQALMQSLLQEDAFGLRSEFVGAQNFIRLWNDETYLASFKTTAVFSLLVASLGLSISLMLAVMADRVVRGAGGYKTLLIWPYAVAPAVAGVLWLFMFAPSVGIVSFWLRAIGIDWNHLLNSGHAMTLIVVAAVWKQVSYNFLFFLAGLQSIPKSLIEAAAIDGAGPWRRFWTVQFHCSRRPPFSCSSSTSSTPSSTPSPSSTPRPRAARARTRRSWSTRSISTASRRSTWAARPPRAWC